MEFQWYEFELIEKKDQWTHITDCRDRNIQERFYHLSKDAESFAENQMTHECRISCTVNHQYRIDLTKLARGLYFCAAIPIDKESNAKLPWAIVKIRKHIAKVPMNIVDEYVERTYKRTGEE